MPPARPCCISAFLASRAAASAGTTCYRCEASHIPPLFVTESPFLTCAAPTPCQQNQEAASLSPRGNKLEATSLCIKPLTTRNFRPHSFQVLRFPPRSHALWAPGRHTLRRKNKQTHAEGGPCIPRSTALHSENGAMMEEEPQLHVPESFVS